MQLFFKHAFVLSVLFVFVACDSKSKQNNSAISVEPDGQSLLTLPKITGQVEERVIHINPNEATSWNLSQIAETITPISLKSYKDFSKNGAQFYYLTNEYLFIVGRTAAIAQLDLSGKYIRTVYCDDFITGITGDTDKKEIYICTKSKIICYDYALKEKKTFSPQFDTYSIFCHQNKLWISSVECEAGMDTTRQVHAGTLTYKISSLDRITGTESILPFELKQDFERVGVYQLATFSVYNDQLVFSNEVNSTLYAIKNDSVYPFVRYEIEPAGDLKYDLSPLNRQGFTGKNLWIEYWMTNRSTNNTVFNFQSSIYLEDTKTGQSYNMHRVFYDDIYHTGDCYLKLFVNNQGHFIIFREASALQKSTNLEIPTDASAIFIGKFK